MDFNLPAELQAYLQELDAFIAEQIAPLQARDDHQIGDHRGGGRLAAGTLAIV